MYSLILFSPIFILVYLYIVAKYLGGFYTSICVVISTFLAVFLCFDAFFFQVFSSFSLVYNLPISKLISFGFFEFSFSFYFDSLSLSIFILISFVSLFIQIFSISYIGEDASFVRFIIYLAFFMVSILLLVGSPNFLQLFFGWELVGLASFLLINFWFSRQDANFASFKAITVNRVGDCCLLLAMFIFFYEFGTLEFDIIFCLSHVHSSQLLGSAILLLVIGSFAKSAQFIFHSWLPDAMEGPTPVSALLHSATMVTAGVFLVIRFIEILEVFPIVRTVTIFAGLFTALYALSIGAIADDTKRVAAYTTLNQLGFMFFGCGSLAYATVLFHLISHGLYKSFSFLTAAVELHDFEDEQDGEVDLADSVTQCSYYDLLSTGVFFSINAIPFTSPSISKEFMLLSGMNTLSEYCTYLLSIILFASPVDEGRDESESMNYEFYCDDTYVVSGFSLPMFIGCSGLGFSSFVSASFLEDLFLDIAFVSSVNDFSWLDCRGTVLIFLPFVAFVLSELDSSRAGLKSDFFAQSIIRNSASSQTLFFNMNFWYYDEFIASAATKFYKSGFVMLSHIMDKGYLEQVYIGFAYIFLGRMKILTDFFYINFTLERLAFSMFVFAVFFVAFFSSFGAWAFISFFLCEEFFVDNPKSFKKW